MSITDVERSSFDGFVVESVDVMVKLNRLIRLTMSGVLMYCNNNKKLKTILKTTVASVASVASIRHRSTEHFHICVHPSSLLG